MIPNQDNYLFLKQMLAVIQTQREDCQIEFNGSVMDPESTSALAVNKIAEIEEQFTVPRFVGYLEKGVTINFDKIIEAIKFCTLQINTDKVEDNKALDLVTEVSQPGNLYRAIVELPIPTYYDEHKVNLNNNALFPFTAQTAIDAANAVDDALILINKWVIDDLPHFSLAQLIILLNCVQLLDESFQFGNYEFMGC